MNAEAINLMFRAFSDPTRLRILHLLKEGTICVGDLVEILQVPQPTASRHLQYLRKTGLVDVHKDGRWCFYALAVPKTKFQRKLLGCLGSCFREVPEIRADLVRARRLRSAGGCCAPRSLRSTKE